MLERETKNLSSDAKYNLNGEVTREICSTKDDILSYLEKYNTYSNKKRQNTNRKV